MRLTRPRRKARYYDLLGKHLLHDEALQFSKARHYYPWLQHIVENRGYEWEAFQLERKERGWGRTKSERMWRKRVESIYIDLPKRYKGWAVYSDPAHKHPIAPRINPWNLKAYVYDQLPAEELWDSGTAHYSAVIKTYNIAVIKQMRKGRRK